MMMMTDRELMQQALDALESDCDATKFGASEALRARLAQPEPSCKTGSQCVGGKCERCAVQNPVAYTGNGTAGREADVRPTGFFIQADRKPEPEPVATLFGSLPVYDVPPKQEPVAWMHNFIDEVVIAHRPVDLDRHPDRWTALYKDPTPCQTCEALARTVMMDQTSHDAPPQREWQGLTDEGIHSTDGYEEDRKMYRFARAIEAKLKEKNHG